MNRLEQGKHNASMNIINKIDRALIGLGNGKFTPWTPDYKKRIINENAVTGMLAVTPARLNVHNLYSLRSIGG